MKDISKLKNYREKHRRYYCLDFSSDYEIHNIDLNHNNNNINNLLLLPKKLHSKYHYYINCIKPFVNGYEITIDISVNSSFLKVNEANLKGLLDTISDIQQWLLFKEELDIKKFYCELGGVEQEWRYLE